MSAATPRIYFAASIRGGRHGVERYEQLIRHLSRYGRVLTEHIVASDSVAMGVELGEEHIYDRDMHWLLSSDIVVAEVTQPSLGVGYEIGKALEHNKRVICLYYSHPGRKLSAMIAGNLDVEIYEYEHIDQAKGHIDTAMDCAHYKPRYARQHNQ